MAMRTPTVSIITPTSRREHYLPAIAACVQSQTVDWEWLVHDDSPAPSAFMQALAAADGRVRYVHSRERVPIGSKRNLLIGMASGDCIAHFDDDDYYAPDYLREFCGLLDAQGADLVKLSGFYVWAPSLQFLGYMDLNARVGRHFELVRGELREVLFHDGMQIGADLILFYGFSYVYRRRLAQMHRFDDIDLCEDESFARRVVASGAHFIAVNDVNASCLHLVHPASTARCFARERLPADALPRLFPGWPEHAARILPERGGLAG